MDPLTQFCHNLDCPARGQVGQGNIHVQSRAHRRYRCTTCGRTFAETRGTPLYRKRTAQRVELLNHVLQGIPEDLGRVASTDSIELFMRRHILIVQSAKLEEVLYLYAGLARHFVT